MDLKCSPYFIKSFSHLVNMFNNQFSCNRTFERLTSDLYIVTLEIDESLKYYVKRIPTKELAHPNIHVKSVVEGSKMGLKKIFNSMSIL